MRIAKYNYGHELLAEFNIEYKNGVLPPLCALLVTKGHTPMPLIEEGGDAMGVGLSQRDPVCPQRTCTFCIYSGLVR